VPPGDTIECPSPSVPVEPCFISPTGECIPSPSYGSSCDVTYGVQIPIPTIGVILARWGFGSSFRQVHICTCGGVNSQRERTDYRATTTQEQERGLDVAAGLGNGLTERDIHRTNRFVRTNARRWDSSAGSDDQNRQEKRTGSDTSNHKESKSFGSSLASRVSSARSDGSLVASRRLTQEERKSSQWVMALSALRANLWEQIQRVQTNRANVLNSTLLQMGPLCMTPHRWTPYGKNLNA
jgi:hypothetical protein